MSKQLTTKDLTELSELLEGESLAFKKCKSYAQLASDPELRDRFNRFATHHKNRYSKLLTYLVAAN